jgi:hypothetical protein
MDPSGTHKWMPLEIPGEDQSASFSGGKEYIDRSGFVFTLESVLQLVTTSRVKHAMLSGLDRI